MSAFDTIFKLNNTDYSAHVIAEGYAVNKEPVYQEWTDGGQIKHRDIVRYKLIGTFNMMFKTPNELASFMWDLEACKTDANTYPVILRANNANNTGLESTTNVFFDFQPVRKRDATWADTFDVFEVTIEEP